MKSPFTIRYYRKLLSGLPKKLTVPEIMERKGLTYMRARTAVLRTGYQTTDGRSFCQRAKRKFAPEKVDWKRSNIELARLYGVSRERVRQMRATLGKAPVESRGRKAACE